MKTIHQFTHNVTSMPRPRGWPHKQRPSVSHIMSSRSCSNSSDSEAEGNIVSKEVTEKTAQGHDHTFSYQEMPGLKHWHPKIQPLFVTLDYFLQSLFLIPL